MIESSKLSIILPITIKPLNVTLYPFKKMLDKRTERKRKANTKKELSKLSAHQLRDIGLMQYDIDKMY